MYITYKVPPEDKSPIISGMTLTNGRPEIIGGKKVVKFAERKKGQQIAVIIDGRPELAALVAEYEALKATENAEREARWAAERALQDAEDAPLIAKMEAEFHVLCATVPDDAIKVDVILSSDGDGGKSFTYKFLDINLNWDEVTHKSVGAIRPGALGAFDRRDIAWCSIEQLAKATARHEAKKIQKEKARTEHEENINRSVPANAVAAYHACNGNPENFGDGIDDPRYWLVRNYASAIEHQAL